MSRRARVGCTVRWALAACAFTACVRASSYQCSTDEDCDVGVAGRCELDHRCTQLDQSCATNHRYSDHSGPMSGMCFDDRALPANLCAGGQPPALATGCAADVCQALPACCTTGWSDACVQQAQLRCLDLQCDTRIAITATSADAEALWDLRWDGAQWTARLDDRSGVLAWLAPGPGTSAPRLAGFMAGALVGDDFSLPVGAGRSYFEATSVDFDRDGRATAVLAFTDGGSDPQLEVVKLDDGRARALSTTAAARLAWGDIDHDGFPDALAAGPATSVRYDLLANIQAADYQRAADDRPFASIASGRTNIPVRSLDWIDLDGDRTLDAVAFGNSVDLHVGSGAGISASLLARFDCDPPSTKPCPGPGPDPGVDQTFAGAALPVSTGTQALVLAGPLPKRALYRADAQGNVTPYILPACGMNCPPFLAVVVRDLDGDHALDVIVIDSVLRVFTGLAKDGLVLRAAYTLPTTPPSPAFTVVRASVSGAPR